MNFDDFKAEFIKENRKLKILIGIGIVVFSIGSFISFTQRKYFLYKGRTVFEERPLAEEVCRLAFLSLIDGTPNKFLVSEGIIQLVKKEPFNLEVTKILKLKSGEEGSCKIIVTSGSQLLSFRILLEGKDSNPFYYRLNEIQELAIEEEG